MGASQTSSTFSQTTDPILGSRPIALPAHADAVLLELAEYRFFGGSPPRVGGYPITGHLGSGGMGIVLSGIDPKLQREVAVKLIVADSRRVDRDTMLRALREARALAATAHPNIVEVFNVGTDERGAFIAMERVDGVSLDVWLQTKRETAAIVDVLIQAARGLAAAHEVDLVHGDFKPSNVLVGRDGRTRVADFGLARPLASGRDETGNAGTPAYMAPEQRVDGAAGPLADQFSWAVTAFESLTGIRPRTEQSTRAGLPSWPANARRVSRRLRAVVLRALHTDPARRYRSMDALVVALESAGSRWALIVSLATTIAAATGALVVFPQTPPCAGVDARVDAVLPAARRASITRAFESSRLSYAPQLLGLVEDELDRRVRRWANASERLCEARRTDDRPDPDRDRQGVCLADRRRRLAAAIDVLGDGSVGTVQNAAALVHGLGPDLECEQGAAAQHLRVPAPLLAANVSTLRERLTRAEALAEAGQHDVALELAGELVDDADHVGFAPLTARTRTTYAVLLAAASSSEPGSGRLEDAVWHAAAVGEFAEAARAAVALFGVHINRGRDPELAEYWMREAQVLTERAGNPPASRAALLRARAVFADRHGDRTHALDLARQTVEVTEQAFGTDHPKSCLALAVLGQMLMATGHHREANDVVKRQVQLARRVLGPGHPRLARGLRLQASLAERRGRPEEALRLVLEAVDVLTEAYGPGHPRTLDARIQLGWSWDDAGKSDRAVQVLRDALADAPNAPEVEPAVLSALGQVELNRDRPAAAREYLIRAISRSEGTASDEAVAKLLSELADAQRRLGEYDHARNAAEESLEIRQRHGVPAAIAFGLEELARVAEAEGDIDEAAALHARAELRWSEAAALGGSGSAQTSPTSAAN